MIFIPSNWKKKVDGSGYFSVKWALMLYIAFEYAKIF
jgi:hypothetical protein